MHAHGNRILTLRYCTMDIIAACSFPLMMPDLRDHGCISQMYSATAQKARRARLSSSESHTFARLFLLCLSVSLTPLLAFMLCLCVQDALMMEVQILGSLDHPNIVQLEAFYKEKQFYYLVMEVLAGAYLHHCAIVYLSSQY